MNFDLPLKVQELIHWALYDEMNIDENIPPSSRHHDDFDNNEYYYDKVDALDRSNAIAAYRSSLPTSTFIPDTYADFLRIQKFIQDAEDFAENKSFERILF